MSAPMKTQISFCARIVSRNNSIVGRNTFQRYKVNNSITARAIQTQSWNSTFGILRKYRRSVCFGVGSVIGFSLGYTWVTQNKDVFAKEKTTRPNHTPTKEIKSATDNSNLKLTLYQYQTCPFCCKVRTYLDYYGFAYDVIEVNSVKRKEIKWSKYKKVPILICDGKDTNDDFVQLNDSSVIISILDSYLEDRSSSVQKILSYYPEIETTNNDGKKIIEFPNRYYIMYGDKKCQQTVEQMKEERKWRDWVDKHLVHTLSPNIYRTPSEALQSFKYFSEVGEWEKTFSSFERNMVIYVGSIAMYLIGKKLKYKYHLDNDVRESLYEALNKWTKAVGKRKFMGGDKPNLADLSVYGVLLAIEGCDAWKDALKNTQIKKWYYETKAAVDSHAGSTIMANKGDWKQGS